MYATGTTRKRRRAGILAAGALSASLALAPAVLGDGGVASASSTAANQAKGVVVRFQGTAGCNLLTPVARRQVSGHTAAAACQRDSGPVPKFTIVKVSTKRSKATVTVRDTKGKNHTITLYQSNDTWLISNFSK